MYILISCFMSSILQWKKHAVDVIFVLFCKAVGLKNILNLKKEKTELLNLNKNYFYPVKQIKNNGFIFLN